MSATIKDAALAYAAKGIPVFPCNPADKSPFVGPDRDPNGNRIPGTGGFKKATCDSAQIEAWWDKHPDAMIGIPTGSVSGIDVLDIDVKYDGFASIPGWESLSPVVVRTPSGGAHLWFRADGVRSTTGEIGPGVDTRGEGGYVIGPPSRNRVGAYVFERGSENDRGGLPTFPAALRSRIVPRPAPVASEDPPEEDPELVAAALASIRNDDLPYGGWKVIGLATFRATGGSEAGFRVFDTFSRKSMKYDARNTLREWKGIVRSPPTRIGAGWLYYLATKANYDWAADWDRRIEARIEAANSNAAAQLKRPGGLEAAMAALGAAPAPQIGEPKARAPGPDAQPSRATEQVDEAPPNRALEPNAEQDPAEPLPWLMDPWLQFIVPPFPLDTLPPVLRRFVAHTARSIGTDPAAVAMATLAAASGAVDHQNSLRLQANGRWRAKPRLWVVLVGPPSAAKSPAIREATSSLKAAESKLQREYARELHAWEDAKEAGEKRDKPTPPIRYTAGDVTVEAVGELLSKQTRGLLILQDELSGWIGAMDRYNSGKGGAASRAFWLQAYDGSPWTSDRVGRGSLFVENSSVSILGGIQPARLAQLGDLQSDGLLQRFVPVMMGRPSYSEDISDQGAIGDYEWLISELLARPAQEFRISQSGMPVVEELRRWLFDLAQGEELGSGFSTFVGKMSGLHGSLMLLLHLVSGRNGDISDETVVNASRIVRQFIVPHGLSFYQATLDKGNVDEIRSLGSYILTSDQNRFVASDFSSGVRSLRNLTSWDLAQKISVFVAGGWLAEESRGGAPAKAWNVMPGVRHAMRARREEEIARKAKIRELIRDSAESRTT